jgi:hypothetical protein
VARFFVFVAFAGLVVFGFSRPTLLGSGVVAGAAWTMIALAPQQAGPGHRGRRFVDGLAGRGYIPAHGRTTYSSAFRDPAADDLGSALAV